MRKLEWDDMGVKHQPSGTNPDGIQRNIWMHRSSVESTKDDVHAERMGLGCPIHAQWNEHIRCTSYVYLGRELEMMNNLTPELDRRRRAAWGAYKSIEDVVKKIRNPWFRAHLFNTTVLPALTYASETWAFRKQEENAVSVIERAIERVMLGVSRFTQVRDGIRSSLLRQRSKIGDAAAFAKESNIRWAGHVMRFNNNRWTRAVSDWVALLDIKRTIRRPPISGQIFSRSPSKKIMMLFVSAKGGTTGRLWHAIEKNGRITGARSTSSKINGSQGDQVYAAGSAAQPHTPQTPQPPYTPNGSRFPQPTPSPHYTPDMRSPPLMSPTQAPILPQAGMPRPMSNGEMVTQPMRMVPTPQQPVIPSQFFTYEPNVLMSVHPEICLAGCVLHMFDMDRMFTDKLDLPNIVLAIRMHGGDIEFGAKAYAERAGAITHVIVESIRTQHAHLALKDRKRLVTMQWLVDVLMKKQMDVPWRHAHLPSVFIDGCRPLLGKLVSFSGFDEGERAAMKFMVETMGAKFTPYLSRHNNLLIAKAPGVEKVEKAREWEIPVVNYQWLADNYAGQRVEVDNQRYQLGQPCEGVSPGPYALEMINDQFKQLLLAWKMPIIVSPEQWRRSFDTKQTVENDEGVFPNKKLRSQSAPPSEAEIAAKVEERKKSGGTHPEYVVAFSGIDEENKHVLTQKLRFLGGRACEEIAECTHLVTTNGRRTEKLLEAICLGRNIVNPYWIVHGYECRQWMDTLDYFLHDEDQERHLGYNCKRSVVRARHRKLFEDVQFYITPSVEPSRTMLTRLIRLAGGTVHEDRPAPADIARCIETDAPYIVISCECDLRMVQYLLECNFPVYNTDFVLIALLRQELEPHPLYRVNTASLTRPSAPQPPPGHQQFRPMPPRSVVEQQPQPHRVKA
ncbi:hypothetical protein RB195_002103 [Necator americanus]|uniref:PAX-interacting protein 1 n=1 Tax=Necator americanus TaxID=51031 RepID=A0ABR1DIE3_NECAM